MEKREIAGNQATGLLKLIALACMVVDHIGVALLPQVTELRVIGRIAFPLYAWCLMVGACRTRSMARYLLRVLVVGVISQPLYVMTFEHDWTYLNIFFTLALGLCALWGLREKKWGSQFWAPVLAVAAAAVCGCDYGWKGVLLPIVFYMLRKKRGLLAVGFAAFCLWWDPNSRNLCYMFGIGKPVLTNPVLSQIIVPWFRLQTLAVLSLPLLLVRFPWDFRMPAWVSYGIYPAHLIALYALKTVLK